VPASIKEILMTDLELTKACAEAMGIRVKLIAEPEFHYSDCPYYSIPTLSEAPNPKYDPLHDDAQAMALVKKFRLNIEENFYEKPDANGDQHWHVFMGEEWLVSRPFGIHPDLNRSICECVANIKVGSEPKP